MKILTNFPHLVTGLDVWKRIYILLNGGDISTISGISRKDLEEVGLSPDYWVIIDAVESWFEKQIPTFLALILWLVRTKQRKDGGWIRKPDLDIAETGIAYRYIQLATLLGESIESDKHIINTIEWFKENMLTEGGFGTNEIDYELETGTTARVIRILLMALSRLEGDMYDEELKLKLKDIITSSLMALKKNEISKNDFLCWHHRPQKINNRKECTLGCTLLSMLAYLEVFKFLLKNSEIKSGIATEINSALRQVFKDNIEVEIKEKVNKAFKWVYETVKKRGLRKLEVDILYYILRVLHEAQTNHIIRIDDEILNFINSIEKEILSKLNNIFKKRDFYNLAFVLRGLSVLLRINHKNQTNGIEEIIKQLHKLINLYLDQRSYEKLLREDYDIYHLLLIGISLKESLNALFEYKDHEKTRKEIKRVYDDISSKLYHLPKDPPPFILNKIMANMATPSEVLYKWANNKVLLRIISFLITIDIILLPAVSFTQYALLKMFQEINLLSAIHDTFNFLTLIFGDVFSAMIATLLFLSVWIWMQLLLAKNKVFRILSIIIAFLISFSFLELMYVKKFQLIEMIGNSAILAIILDAISKHIKRKE